MALARRRFMCLFATFTGSLALGTTSASAAPLIPLVGAQPGITPPPPVVLTPQVDSLSARGGQRYADDVASDVGTSSPPSSATPTAVPVGGKHIGLQAGHWQIELLPPPYKTQTGSSGRGKTEAQVTLPIARAAASVLTSAGHTVDVLPAGIPAGYKADLVVAIHCDGGPADRRGYFVDYSFRSGTHAAELKLAAAITNAYLDLGIPNVFRGTEDSRYYYGYYSVDPSTPMVLIETGFLTNAQDQAILIDRPDVAGAGIARGIQDYLAS